ncbi:hypothetical protein Tco_1105856 [Tanacetum coccineum]
MLVYQLQLRTKLFVSNSEPMVVRKIIPTARKTNSPYSGRRKPSMRIKNINSQYISKKGECSLKYIVWSFGACSELALICLSFGLVRSFDLFGGLDLPGAYVVEDALAQGADGLGLMKNKDHQVFRNKQKLEEDASDYGASLDELKHDLSTEESMAQKYKDTIVENKRVNIKPNKAGSKEVADLDLDQLPTLAFVVLVSSIIPISNLLHNTFSHTTGLITPDLVCLSTYQLLQSSTGDSRPDVSFDMSASLEHLSSSAHTRLATSTLR